jgi:hypothetical protein
MCAMPLSWLCRLFRWLNFLLKHLLRCYRT